MNFKRDPMSCPHCGKLNDQNTCISEPSGMPDNGDVCLCIGCGKWAVFNNGEYRLPTMDEWSVILKDPVCQKAERAWKKMRA
jgi:hypothetical protein